MFKDEKMKMLLDGKNWSNCLEQLQSHKQVQCKTSVLLALLNIIELVGQYISSTLISNNKKKSDSKNGLNNYYLWLTYKMMIFNGAFGVNG